MNVRAAVVVVVVALLLAACAGGGAGVADSTSTVSTEQTASAEVPRESATTTVSTTSTVPIVDRLPPLENEIRGAIRTDEGSALAITATDGDAWIVVGACEAQDRFLADGVAQIPPQHVVLDPGTPSDTEIAAHNLEVAELAADLLEQDGIAAALTRTGDAPLSASARAAFAPAVGAAAMVSIHHAVAEAGGPEALAPRPVVIHQIDDRESQRLAGLVHQELTAGLAELGGPWATLEEPGVHPLLNQRGQDYFVVLQQAGTPAVRVEIAAMDENGTTLLANEEGRQIEAEALAAAIVRFLITDEEGDGFVEPVETVRIAPTRNAPGGCG